MAISEADKTEQAHGDFLVGMKEISGYARVSEGTLRKWIDDDNFPAKKVGGSWLSDKQKIDEWRLKLFGDYEAGPSMEEWE